jgi:hypothetical protein
MKVLIESSVIIDYLKGNEKVSVEIVSSLSYKFWD